MRVFIKNLIFEVALAFSVISSSAVLADDSKAVMGCYVYQYWVGGGGGISLSGETKGEVTMTPDQYYTHFKGTLKLAEDLALEIQIDPYETAGFNSNVNLTMSLVEGKGEKETVLIQTLDELPSDRDHGTLRINHLKDFYMNTEIRNPRVAALARKMGKSWNEYIRDGKGLPARMEFANARVSCNGMIREK